MFSAPPFFCWDVQRAVLHELVDFFVISNFYSPYEFSVAQWNWNSLKYLLPFLSTEVFVGIYFDEKYSLF